jgi:hypothetical protein
MSTLAPDHDSAHPRDTPAVVGGECGMSAVPPPSARVNVDVSIRGYSAPRTRKAAQPESITQARKWDRDKRRAALAAGVCDACAARYSWGVQVGFRLSRPPCADCAPFVNAATGISKPNGWRRLHAARAVGFSRNGGEQDVKAIRDGLGHQTEAHHHQTVTGTKHHQGTGMTTNPTTGRQSS